MALLHNSVLLKKAFKHKIKTQITVLCLLIFYFLTSLYRNTHNMLYYDYKMHHKTLNIKTLL